MSTRLPVGIRAADWLSVALVMLAAIVAIGGGFRLRMGDIRISFTAADRLLAIGLAVVVARHWWRRRPHLGLRLWIGARDWLQWDPLRSTLPIAIATRVSVLLAGMFAVYIIGLPEGVRPPRVSDSSLLNLPMRWDAGWYVHIAAMGYRWNPLIVGEQNIAFFPALPLLMRGVGTIFGGSSVAFLLAGVTVSHAAFLWALVYLYRLGAREDVLGDTRGARSAVLLLASYPFAVFYSAAYTEALWLLAVVGAFWHGTRQEWGRCALWGLLSGLTRPNGFLLSVALGILVLQQLRNGAPALGSRRGVVAIAAAAAPIAGLLLYSAYVYQLTGNPFQWAIAHEAWGRKMGGLSFTEPFSYIGRHGLSRWLQDMSPAAMNTLAGLAAMAAVVPLTRRLGLPYGVFTLVNLLAPLASGGFLSAGRVTATLFPVFLWLGAVVPDRHREAWVSAFAVGQGLIAVLYYTWRPPY